MATDPPAGRDPAGRDPAGRHPADQDQPGQDPAGQDPAGQDQPDQDPADLGRIRAAVGNALEAFIDRKRDLLAGMSDDLPPWLDAADGLLTGGKRLRPAFCYWGWRAAGAPDCPEILTAAAALELLQASALVHDDLMDASDTRRGHPALHREFASRHVAAGYGGAADRFGAGAAILIGDALLSWTDELYDASGLPADALRRGQPVLDVMRTELIAGQYLDLLSQAAGDTSVAAAMRVITYKTAKYTVERPLQLGGALADAARRGPAATGPAETGAPTGLAALPSEYGLPLGVAFQLRDDVLGVFGDPAQTGKPVGGDIREGKRTVLIALALRRATASQAELLERHLGDRGLTAETAAEMRDVIAGTGALSECESVIAASVQDALSALDRATIPAAARAALIALASSATSRAG